MNGTIMVFTLMLIGAVQFFVVLGILFMAFALLMTPIRAFWQMLTRFFTL